MNWVNWEGDDAWVYCRTHRVARRADSVALAEWFAKHGKCLWERVNADELRRILSELPDL